MTREEAKRFWLIRYENAKDFSDPHWEAQERREHREYVEALHMAIEALSKPKQADDLISRADAIEAMWKALYAYEDLTEKQFMEHEELELGDWFKHRIFVQRMHEECMKAVNSLPSAEPPYQYSEAYVNQLRGERDILQDMVDNMAEPKTGKWVLKEHLWNCDQCGCRINRANPLKGNIWNYNFCPNCGARMEGEKE